MFKSLQGKIQKKEKVIHHQSLAQQKISAIVARYTPQAIAVYHPTHQTLTITTPSKTAASELFLQRGDLHATLHQEGVIVKEVIIR